jgi:hypothetical protein
LHPAYQSLNLALIVVPVGVGGVASTALVLLMCLRLETLLELFAGIVGAVDGVIET